MLFLFYAVTAEAMVVCVQVFDAQNSARNMPELGVKGAENNKSMSDLSIHLSEVEKSLKEKLISVTERQEQCSVLLQEKQHEWKHLDDRLGKFQLEFGSRVDLVEGKIVVLESGLLSGESSAEGSLPTSPDKRDSLNMEIMQQYQVAIRNANERIQDHQTSIDLLKGGQEKWNEKLEQVVYWIVIMLMLTFVIESVVVAMPVVVV